MGIRRVVANIAAADPAAARYFYGDLLGMELAMDMGWILTFAGEGSQQPQVTIASEGGSGTDLPALSIEVDDLDATLERMNGAGVPIVYGPADEPWGVRRFYVRDPFGTLVNILGHR